VKYLPRAFRYLLPHWKFAALSGVVLLLTVLIAPMTPWPLAILIDSVLGDEPMPAPLATVFDWVGGEKMTLLVLIVAAGLALTVLQNAMSVFENYANAKLEAGMVLDFRSDVFRHLERLSLAFHERRRAGMTMYLSFLADAPAHVIMTIPALAQSFLTLIWVFWITYALNPTLALLSLTVVPFLYYSVGYYARHIQDRIWEVRTMEGEALSIIHEAMSMLRVIIAFGREGHEYRRFRNQGERAVDARIRVTLRQTVFTLVVDTITALGTALVLGLGAYYVLRDASNPPGQPRFTVGDLTVVMFNIAMVYKPLETISTTVGSLQDAFVNLKIAYQLLDTEPDVKDAPDAVDVGRTQGHVTFEGVCFSYEGRVDTLSDIAFEARAGQVIALVGPTGAGKTTLVSLLPRFYDLKAGGVFLDGTDVRRLTLKSLRRQISIVLQEPLLFSGTIAENIRYGRLEASMDEIVEAAKAANAHDFIMALPDQYETVLGERGAQLSGGERQRISVARAFLKDAPILILDEPTSSIDSRTEAVILDALDRLMAGRTTFLIAHRLSTIRSADQILVLDHGRLVEQGTHDGLMQRGGLYRQLHDLQTRQPRGQPDPQADGYEESAVEDPV
jgi:ATP-binding cassette subfamily B protein/subfamily B ATP-binding cassette protein MsbA